MCHAQLPHRVLGQSAGAIRQVRTNSYRYSHAPYRYSHAHPLSAALDERDKSRHNAMVYWPNESLKRTSITDIPRIAHFTALRRRGTVDSGSWRYWRALGLRLCDCAPMTVLPRSVGAIGDLQAGLREFVHGDKARIKVGGVSYNTVHTLKQRQNRYHFPKRHFHFFIKM